MRLSPGLSQAHIFGRRARMDWRQPSYPPRLLARPGVGLAAQVEHPRRGDPHPPVSGTESMGDGGALMIIAVVGLWHLGTVTAACLASAGYTVIGFDENADAIDGRI